MAVVGVKERRAAAQGLVDFLNSSWTQFEATATTRQRLLAAGFTELAEKEVAISFLP